MTESTTPPAPSTRRVAPASAGRPRLAALDGLRFLAAMAVVAYHYVAVNHSAWGVRTEDSFPHLQPVAVFGSFGVQLFFVISGFVILMSAWGRDVRSFTASRVGRLFPAYWFSVAAVVALLVLVTPGRKDVGIPEAAANLTMVQRAFGVQDIEPVYWTLWTELRFYVLIGILLAVGMTRRRLIAFAAVWPVLAAVAVRSGNELWSTLLVGSDAPLFAGGMILYLLTKERRSLVLWLLLGLNVALAGVVSGRSQSLRIANSTGVTVGPETYWVAILACFALVAAVALTRLDRLSWRWLTVVGAMTYPLYLLHSSWGQWLIGETSPHLPAGATFVLVTGTMLLVAFLVHRFVERPFGPRLRRAVARDLERTSRALGRTPREARPAQASEPEAVSSR
ncbi:MULTISPECIES: acyltransferase family protein [unclassified Isoptericola]|uniref:acyltransferase family protein n=1 Tax=unclassified Isoptericola TaxID=2623355 RepID=UPI003649E01E